jgi:hypothetical protein
MPLCFETKPLCKLAMPLCFETKPFCKLAMPLCLETERHCKLAMPLCLETKPWEHVPGGFGTCSGDEEALIFHAAYGDGLAFTHHTASFIQFYSRETGDAS